MSEERQTAWEVMRDFFQDKKEKPQELQVFNPLQLKIGDFVFLNGADLSGKSFVVTSVSECVTKVGKNSFSHIDIGLQTADEKNVFLRLNPAVNADPHAKKHCDVLVLFPDYEMGYDEDFCKNVLSDPDGVLNAENDGEVTTYHRLGSGREPFNAELKTIDEANQKEPRVESISY